MSSLGPRSCDADRFDATVDIGVWLRSLRAIGGGIQRQLDHRGHSACSDRCHSARREPGRSQAPARGDRQPGRDGDGREVGEPLIYALINRRRRAPAVDCDVLRSRRLDGSLEAARSWTCEWSSGLRSSHRGQRETLTRTWTLHISNGRNLHQMRSTQSHGIRA